MAKVLILDTDQVLPAVLADRLEASGIYVDGSERPSEAQEACLEGSVDLLLIDLELPTPAESDEPSPLELVRLVRSKPGLGATHILGRLGSGSSEARLEALRAGVDDVLPETCGVDELEIRIRRLLDSRTGEIPLLEGSLGDHQLLEFLQYVRQAARSGTLRIRSRRGSGRLELHRGEAKSALFEKLRDESALLAILGLASGRFRLEIAKIEGPAPEQVLDMQSVLLRAVWLEDELLQHAGSLPKESIPLEAVASPPGPGGDSASILVELVDAYGDLPFGAILDHLHWNPGARRFDLLAQQMAAPQEVDLALALLMERGWITGVLQADAPSTVELASSHRMHWAMISLLRRARSVGHDGGVFSLVLLAERGTWKNLVALFGEYPDPPIRRLHDQLIQHRGGSASIPAEIGTVAFHVHVLDAESVGRLSPVMAACDGLVAWLDELEEPTWVEALVARLEESRRDSFGVLVATEEGPRARVDALVKNARRCVVSHYPPKSLGGLLRFFPARDT